MNLILAKTPHYEEDCISCDDVIKRIRDGEKDLTGTVVKMQSKKDPGEYATYRIVDRVPSGTEEVRHWIVIA